MRLALGSVHIVDDQILAFARQLGATDIIVNTPEQLDTGKGYYDFMELVQFRKRIEDAGLRLAAIENVPRQWYNKVLMGLAGRDEQIENWCKTLRNMGKAGVPVLGYHFMALGVMRTSRTTPGRGEAKVSSFDYDLVKDGPVPDGVNGEVSDEQMWDHFTYFIKAVIPVAEEAGVRMGLHPDDPPISPIAGVARIFRSHAALRRLVETVPSHNNAVEFCQGTVSEMPENVLDAIRYFGSRDKILYVHFRNVSGPVPSFQETFIDEGHVDMLEAIKAYKDAGFDGPIIDDHVPQMVDDTPYGHRGRAYAMGYLKGLIDAASANGA